MRRSALIGMLLGLVIGLPRPIQARSSWTHETLGAVWAAPLVTAKGRVFVGGEDSIFYGFAADGTLLWSYKASDGFSGWPVQVSKSLIAAGNRNGSLYVFDTDGELKHKVPLGQAIVGRPALARGVIYLATDEARLLALRIRDRKLLWVQDTPARITAFPAVDPRSARIYLGCQDGSLLALDSRGNRKWTVKASDSALSGGIAPVSAGVVVASVAGDVVGVGADGRIRYRHTLSAAHGGVAPGRPGSFAAVLGTLEGRVVALDQRGKQLWELKADGAIRSVPTVTRDRILIGTDRGTVYILDHLGQPVGLLSASGAIRGGITVARGRILFGSQDRRLYVLAGPGDRSSRPWSQAAGLKALLQRTPQGTLRWRSELAGPVATGVGRGHGERLLAGTWGNRIYVLGSDGKVQWTYNCGADVDTLPAMGSKGDVVFGCGDGGFYGLKPGGDLRYRFPVNKGLASSPALARDGTAYFGARDKRIYALTPQGKIAWRILTGSDVDGSVRIAPDGVVYVGSDDRHLYAINPLGHILWYLRLAGAIRSRPALAADGTVYVTAFDQRLHAVTKEGKLAWEYQTGGQIQSDPAVDPSGSIYFGSRDHHLYALAPTGLLRWRFVTAGEVDSNPVVTPDGLVAVGSDDGNLYVLDSKGRLKWWYPARSEIRGGLVSQGKDGTIVFGTMNGSVLSVGPPTSKPVTRQTTPVKERFLVGQTRVGPALHDEQDQVIVAGMDGVIRAFGSDRWLLWRARVGQDVLSRLLPLGQDLYVTDARGNLTAVRDGHLRFRLQLAKGPPSPPVAVTTAEGPLVVVGTPSGRLWAVTPQGKVRWLYGGTSAIDRAPLPLGSSIVVASGKDLVGIGLTGHRKWSHQLGAGILSGPVGLGGKLALVGDGLGGLVAIDAQGKKRWQLDLGSGVAQLSALPQGIGALARLANGCVMEIAGASGERLVKTCPPRPVAEIAATPNGVVYLLCADSSLWKLDRARGRVEQVLDLPAGAIHVEPAASGGLLVVSADGQVSFVKK